MVSPGRRRGPRRSGSPPAGPRPRHPRRRCRRARGRSATPGTSPSGGPSGALHHPTRRAHIVRRVHRPVFAPSAFGTEGDRNVTARTFDGEEPTPNAPSAVRAFPAAAVAGACSRGREATPRTDRHPDGGLRRHGVRHRLIRTPSRALPAHVADGNLAHSTVASHGCDRYHWGSGKSRTRSSHGRPASHRPFHGRAARRTADRKATGPRSARSFRTSCLPARPRSWITSSRRRSRTASTRHVVTTGVGRGR